MPDSISFAGRSSLGANEKRAPEADARNAVTTHIDNCCNLNSKVNIRPNGLCHFNYPAPDISHSSCPGPRTAFASGRKHTSLVPRPECSPPCIRIDDHRNAELLSSIKRIRRV